MTTQTPAFLLTTSSRDLNGRFEITLHAAAEDGRALVITVDNFRPMFFVPRAAPEESTRDCAERRQLPLKAMDGTDVDCLYFSTGRACRDAAEKLRMGAIRVYESDLSPVSRFLMERLVRGSFVCEGDVVERGNGLVCRNPRIRGGDASVDLRVLSLDIETNAHTSEVYSIACGGSSEVVFIRASVPESDSLRPCADERSLLQQFSKHVAREDPDVIIGWNVIDFDLHVLQERFSACRVPFAIGRGGVARLVESQRAGNRLNARVPGRVVMDVPTMLRAYNYTFEEYSLEYVSHAMLGRGKLVSESGADKIAEINRLFAEDPVTLARYNLVDTRLTREIFDKAEILPNAMERSRRSGHLLDRTGGSVAAFDYLYLPRLHRAGVVAGDAIDVPPPTMGLRGGYVMDCDSGVYQNVLVLDFKSLYPTIMMTFLIDPLGLALKTGERVTTPHGTSFSRDAALLPAIIAELMEARAEAKRTGNSYLSQAIKIIMNSFYGVLGTTACRFFSEDLAQTITETGQFLLKLTIEHIEQVYKHRVIYGDTDSLFVLLGEGAECSALDTGRRMAADITAWLAGEISARYHTESALELEFETHFRHFLIPSVRGGGEGSKKHYCGSIESPDRRELVFKGMESARTDWTDLAKEFQHELCMRLFDGAPVEDYIVETVAAVRAGAADDKLIYRKRMRKPIDSYVSAVPPHVQAARLLPNPGRLIRYVITTDGPQPAGAQTAPLDYEHYVEAQLRPVADSLLDTVNLHFDRIVSGQQDLFD